MGTPMAQLTCVPIADPLGGGASKEDWDRRGTSKAEEREKTAREITRFRKPPGLQCETEKA